MRTEDDTVMLDGCQSQWCAFAITANSVFVPDVRASRILTVQIFPVSIAIAIASGLRPIYGASCAAVAGLLASGLGESKVRISAPNILFVAVVAGIVGQHGVLGLSLSTSLAGIFLVFLAGTGLAAAVPFIPRAIVVSRMVLQYSSAAI